MTDTSSSENQPAGPQGTSERSSSSNSADSQPDAAQAALYDRAVQYLSMQTGDAAEAKRALEATASPELTDPVNWALEAATWLACINEVDLEQQAMGTAMEQSLVEAEAEKQKETPVYEQSEEQLKARYAHSIILQELQQQANTVLPSLWKQHQKSLLDLLEIELKACKWYPRQGTRLYLQKLGQDCASLLCCPAAQTTAAPDHSAQTRQQGDTGQAQSPVKQDAATVLSEQLLKLQRVLYAMPDTSGAVPVAFTEIEETQEDEGIDEVLERPRKRLCGADCVDLL
ncbi:hypothetical protein ABBQ32_003213 [Trebouxia sp. C0010 RCD-2024]